MQKVFLDHYRKQVGEELNKNSLLFKKMQEIIDTNNIQEDFLELTVGNAKKLEEAFRECLDEDLSLNDAKEDAYKYSEIKDWLDQQIRNGFQLHDPKTTE